MESSTLKWIEVEPGAPLPPEVPPWAERHNRVKRAELPDSLRRPALQSGVAVLAGSVVAALLVDARAYAGIPLGLALLYAGLTGGERHEVYVPSAEGRHVLAEVAPAPADLAAQEKARRTELLFTTVCVTVPLAVLASEYAAGLEWAQMRDFLLPIMAAALPGVVTGVSNAVRRRMKSEAEVSERFLEASDPRKPLPAASEPAGVALSAGAGEAPMLAPPAARVPVPEPRQAERVR